MNKTNYLLLLIFIWIQYSLWIGKNGILDFVRVYDCIKLYEHEYDLNHIKMYNNQLKLDNYALLHENNFIEEYARYTLGMIKPGECFYQFDYNNAHLYLR